MPVRVNLSVAACAVGASLLVASSSRATIPFHPGTKGIQPAEMKAVFTRVQIDPAFTARYGKLYSYPVIQATVGPLKRLAETQLGKDADKIFNSSGEYPCSNCATDLVFDVRLDAPEPNVYRVSLAARTQGRVLHLQTQRSDKHADLFIRRAEISSEDRRSYVIRSVLNDVSVLGRAACEAVTQQQCGKGKDR